MNTAALIIFIFQAYLSIGLLVSAWFLAFGQRRLSDGVRHGSLGFRVLTVPGTALLWPLVLRRYARLVKERGA